MAEWWEEDMATEAAPVVADPAAAPAADPAAAAAVPPPAKPSWQEEDAPEPEPDKPRTMLDVLTDVFTKEPVGYGGSPDPNVAGPANREGENISMLMQGLRMTAPGIFLPLQAAFSDEQIGAAGEVAATIGSSVVAEPVSGLAGMAASMLPGPAGQGAEVVAATQEAMTLTPSGELAQEWMTDIGTFLQPVGEFINTVEGGMGGAVLEATGSELLATAAHTLPTAVLEILGMKILRRGGKTAENMAVAQERIKINPDATPDEISTAITPPEQRTFQQVAEALRNKDTAAVAAEVRPDADVLKAAEELGVDLNPSHYSTSEAYKRVEQQILKSVPGSELAAREADAIIKLGQKADELIDDFRGQIDKSILDDRVRTTMETTIKESAETSDRLYKRIKEVVPVSVKSPMRASRAYIDGRLAEMGGDTSLLRPPEKRLMKMMNADRPPNYGAMDELRQQIGDGYKGKGIFKDADKATLDQVYKSLLIDQSGIAKVYKMGPEFDAARKLVATRKVIEKEAVALFGREFAGSILPKLKSAATAMTKGDVSKFKQLMKALPDDMRSTAAVTMLNDLFTVRAKGSGSIGAGFARAFEDLNRNAGVKAELFKYLPAEAQQRFNAIGTVSQGIFRAKALENTSKTAASILGVLESGGMLSKLYGVARPAAQFATFGIAQMGDLAQSVAKKSADRVAKVDKLLASNTFNKAINKAMEGRIKEAETMMNRSAAWKAYKATLGEGTLAQLAAVGPIAWLTQQDEDSQAPPEMDANDQISQPPGPGEPAGMPAATPPPEVFPGVQ